MISKIIRLSAANPILTIFIFMGLTIFSVFTMKKQPLDALPDLSETQVIVSTDWSGQSPNLVEDQVTYPLVTLLLSSPKVKYVRGLSMFGGSQITVVFEEGTDIYWARSRISEKLSSISNLPNGVAPTLGPEATAVGWVYQYALVDKSGHSNLADLRSLQDWHLRFALAAVPGVAEVASVGGFVKQYEISLDPIKLQAFNVTPLQVSKAVREGNQEIGANVLEMGGTQFIIRGRGYTKTLEDISKIPVAILSKGRVITVGDIGRVQKAPAPRVGAGEFDGEGEAVSGIVIMRVGENALTVIDGIKQKLESIKASLPPGVEIVTVYDRSDLIHKAIETLKHVLIEEILIVALVVSLFLWHARASWVAILPLPIAVILSFLPMYFSGLTINLMSLGGVALAIGAMVDAGIILVENAHKHLEGIDTSKIPDRQRRKIIIDAMVEMGRPLFFSLLVITVSFVPIFALTGREGRLFSPLAFTKTVSMAWAAVLAITFTPALAMLFLKGKFVTEEKNVISIFLRKIYEPAVVFVVDHKKKVIAAAALIIALTIPVMLNITTEFMPPLNEGTILYMPTAVPGMSLDVAVETMQKQNQIIKSTPEVEHVYAKAGRANSATDPAPINMFETIILLKPESEWRSGMNYEKIVSELNNKLTFPGMPNIWWMPIQTRLEMLSTGIRTPIGIKVLGSDLKEIEKAAIDIEVALRELPESRSVFAERSASGSYIDINIKRDIAALYGLNIAAVHSIIQAAVGGIPASIAIEGRERYSISVRFAPDFRNDINALRNLVLQTPTGAEVSLNQIADINVTTGDSMISSENGQLLGLVFVNTTKDTGLAEYVAKAKEQIAKKVQLTTGIQLEWSGQYKAYELAKETLVFVVPFAVFIIILILFLNTRSLPEVGIILLAVPFSLVGAFWLLWLLDYKLSVATWVGILALAGLDAETGVVMLMYLTKAWQKKISLVPVPTITHLFEAIQEGAVQRVRPKIMTVLAALIGLLPVMWSTDTGSEVMKRIAAPMVGGIVTSGMLELLVYPAIFALWKGRNLKKL